MELMPIAMDYIHRVCVIYIDQSAAIVHCFERSMCLCSTYTCACMRVSCSLVTVFIMNSRYHRYPNSKLGCSWVRGQSLVPKILAKVNITKHSITRKAAADFIMIW